jgi:hypothetical protein
MVVEESHMPESRKAHRERVHAKRRTRVREERYYVTRTEQARVQSRRRSAGRRHAARLGGAALVLIGAVMGIAHVFEHLGAFRLLAPGWQDLLLGYPMAGLLVISGLVLLSSAKAR